MNKTSIIYLFLIALLFSACKDEITTGFDRPEGDKLTVTAVMPGESSEGETRVSLQEKSGSLQIESKWQTNDQIHFFFCQNGNIVDAGKVTVSNPANGSKQVSFEINYPQGVNPANPFDLYAFCGTEAKVKNGNLLVDINPRMCNYLESVSAPVWCEVKNISASNSSLSLNFKHLGTYELIHLNNKSSSSLSFNLCNLYPAVQSSDVWYHIPQKNGNNYDNCYYNPVSGSVEIVTESTTSYTSGSVSSTVLPGSTKIISNWYFPNNKSVPETKLKLYSPSSEIISANSRPSKNSSLQQSKAYHLYANWDGNKLDITDENFNTGISGTTGNLTWRLVDGTLTISGNGDMPDYNYSSSPWYSNKDIRSVIIEEGVMNIGSHAFDSCSSLVSIDLPDGLTSIGRSAFFGCSSLASISIPDNVPSIGIYAFYDCRSLISIDLPIGLTSIGYGAFVSCSSLVSIDVPDGVMSIGEIAFSGCSSLVSIDLPDSLTSIGRSAFSGCSSLASISIPDNVPSIEEKTFYGCRSLVFIDLPDGLTSIGSSAFYDCNSLISITIPDNVTNIANATFFRCSSLFSIVMPDGLTSIGDAAFSGCSSLASITIPEGVLSIEDAVFRGCSSLISIAISNGVTHINSYAFDGCTSLVSIDLPYSLTSIGDAAFINCHSLASVVIPEGVTSIGAYIFASCNSLVSIDIPDRVASLEESAFFGCSSLVSIDLPDDLTSIGTQAFWYCSSLISIDVPEGVTSIDSEAFYKCFKLIEIISRNPIPPTINGYGTFDSINTLTCVIKVPAGSVELYQQVDGWKAFSNIVEL